MNAPDTPQIPNTENPNKNTPFSYKGLNGWEELDSTSKLLLDDQVNKGLLARGVREQDLDSVKSALLAGVHKVADQMEV
jgi:hypothetical protein